MTVAIIAISALILLALLFPIARRTYLRSIEEAENEEQRDSFGKQGEDEVSKILASLPEGYRIYNDVMLKGSTSTVQIDHVVVSAFGVFVIETKNYKGEIFGKERDRMWQKMWKGTMKQFYNPIKQNKAHVSALKMNTMMKNANAYIPVVAFSNEADLKNLDTPLVKLKSKNGTVVNFKHIIAKITAFKEKVLSETQVEKICISIEQLRLDSEKMAKKHVKNIEKSLEDRKFFSEYGNCPRCKGKLLLRNGRRGFFLGCSNYPRCKFTKEVKGEN